MKYANFYDLESLTLLNRHEGCACSIKECDVEKVNRLISRMREDRDAGQTHQHEIKTPVLHKEGSIMEQLYICSI